MGFFTQAKTQTYQPTHNRGYLFPAHDRRHSSGTSACDIDHTIKILPRPPFGSVAFLFRFARGPKRPNSAHLLNPKNKNKHAEPRKREPYISGVFLLSRRSEGTPPPYLRRRRRLAYRNVHDHGRIGVRAGTLVVVSEDESDRGGRATPREDERPAVDRRLFELGWDVKGCAMREEERDPKDGKHNI